MLEQRCEILELDPHFIDVVFVRVPGIYPRGAALPKRMARMYKPAAQALDRAMVDISSKKGTLFISDMFRSASDQAKAHQDYLSGKKDAYSPPAGGSMHEAGRAIDIDTGHTGIGLKAVKAILKTHGFIGIAESGSECWHHDWRGPDGQRAYDSGGPGMSRYRAMARFCIQKIGNTAHMITARKEDDRVAWIQRSLNLIRRSDDLHVDGIYGPQTRGLVKIFQTARGLEPDGIVGPITEAVIKEALKDVLGPSTRDLLQG